MAGPKRDRGAGSRPSRSKTVRKKASAARRAEPVFGKSDVRRILVELMTTLAPADVAELINREDEVRARLEEIDPVRFALQRTQIELALDLLRDHVEGRCPQIPYYTISLLAAGVWYFTDAIDIIPDFLPRIGNLDDAAVVAMAFEMGRRGVVRYCDWKGVGSDIVLGRTARV